MPPTFKPKTTRETWMGTQSLTDDHREAEMRIEALEDELEAAVAAARFEKRRRVNEPTEPASGPAILDESLNTSTSSTFSNNL